MSAVRSRLLSRVQTRLETFLGTDTCTISREGDSSDSTGAPTYVPVIVASNVPCRLIEGKSDTENIGDQESLSDWYRLIVPIGTELGVDYQITLSDGAIYQVIELVTQRTEKMDLQALVKRGNRGG